MGHARVPASNAHSCSRGLVKVRVRACISTALLSRKKASHTRSSTWMGARLEAAPAMKVRKAWVGTRLGDEVREGWG